ncbi:hypothetical protein Y032_0536g3106 [Ancylostoma ceylanicum]|uniref:Uncharacterized protein n=1 Tax=Ancylostoma ceylanicum TaxID=53326 RepID=A0A016WR54_9BILA|nr:hypothetical protein Y032_0536g3106 [Ancylostoma ceylanicum]
MFGASAPSALSIVEYRAGIHKTITTQTKDVPDDYVTVLDVALDSWLGHLDHTSVNPSPERAREQVAE